jgi:hypothetical protein
MEMTHDELKKLAETGKATKTRGIYGIERWQVGIDVYIKLANNKVVTLEDYRDNLGL